MDSAADQLWRSRLLLHTRVTREGQEILPRRLRRFTTDIMHLLYGPYLAELSNGLAITHEAT